MKKSLINSCRYWQNNDIIQDASTTLQQGNVIISSTDTVLGLLAIVSQKGYDSLNSIKKRVDKPYLILISDKSQLAKYVQMPLTPTVQNLIDTYWPGPLTIIFNAKAELPDYIKSPEGTVAVRMPNDPHMLSLLEKTGPLFSTSANLSGQPIPDAIDELDQLLIDQVAFIVCDSAATTDNKKALPSTIIDCTQGDTIKIIRQGALEIIKTS